MNRQETSHMSDDTTKTETKPDAAKEAKAEKPARAKAPAVVTVVAKQPSRWRIGRQFGPTPVEIPLDQLSEDELARLNADPLLVVTAGSAA
jgi:hypothetical protein